MPIIETVLGILTLASGIALILTITALITKQRLARTWINFLNKHAIFIIFIISLAATLGSLYFSDILGYEPCKLCWYQRILMYPQVLLAGIAMMIKDKRITTYTLWLSVIGGLIALNHYILQITKVSLIPCSAVGYSASCSQYFTLQFGYITIPMMALTAFLLIIVLSRMHKKINRRQ